MHLLVTMDGTFSTAPSSPNNERIFMEAHGWKENQPPVNVFLSVFLSFVPVLSLSIRTAMKQMKID